MLARMWRIKPSVGGMTNVSSMWAPTRPPANDGLGARSKRGRHPAPRKRPLGHQTESSPHRFAVHGKFRYCGLADDPVLRSAIQAAAQMIFRGSGLEADLYAGAPGRKRHLVGIVTDQRINVGLRGRDSFGVRGRH